MKKVSIIIGILSLFVGTYLFLTKDNKDLEKIGTGKNQKQALEGNKIPTDYKGQFQEVSVRVDGSSYPGYFPDKKEIKKGVPVRLSFITENEQSCALAVNVPEAGVQNKILPETGITTIEYMPQNEGELNIFCGMNGMFQALIKVLA